MFANKSCLNDAKSLEQIFEIFWTFFSLLSISNLINLFLDRIFRTKVKKKKLHSELIEKSCQSY